MQMPQKKAGIIILAAAGVLVLALGFWSISYKIRSPFFLRPVDPKLLGGGTLTDLTKDTDGDGVTDWEETNIYHSSPYLADTDSDNVSDSEEINNGTDPNCPEGKTCGAAEAIIAPSSGAPDFPAETAFPDVTAGIPANLTAGQVRGLLKEGGMSDENLNKLDDKALLEIYQEALKESQ